MFESRVPLVGSIYRYQTLRAVFLERNPPPGARQVSLDVIDARAELCPYWTRALGYFY